MYGFNAYFWKKLVGGRYEMKSPNPLKTPRTHMNTQKKGEITCISIKKMV